MEGDLWEAVLWEGDLVLRGGGRGWGVRRWNSGGQKTVGLLGGRGGRVGCGGWGVDDGGEEGNNGASYLLSKIF